MVTPLSSDLPLQLYTPESSQLDANRMGFLRGQALRRFEETAITPFLHDDL